MTLTDRQRVELALIPSILLGVVFDGAESPTEAYTEETTRLLYEASVEPLNDLLMSDRRKLLRRIARVHDEVLAPYRGEGAVVAKVGLIAFYLLEAIVDAGYLLLKEGSAIDQALKILLPALEPAANIPDLDRSAQKAARKVMIDLHGRGFFRGVTLA